MNSLCRRFTTEETIRETLSELNSITNRKA